MAIAIDPRQEWATPADFWSVIQHEFAPTIDVCATEANAKCVRFISPEQDALNPENVWLQTCGDVGWCNPGFSNLMPWAERAYREARFSGGTQLLLGLGTLSAKWFAFVDEFAAEGRLIGGKRIQFDPAEGVQKSSNAKDNILAIFRPKPVGAPCHWWLWDWTKDQSSDAHAARSGCG